MLGYRGTKRRKHRRGGDGFDASQPSSGEAAFMTGKRKQDEAEAQRLGQLASTHKKEVVEKLEEHARTHPESNLGTSPSSSRRSSTAGRRRRHKKTHRRRR